MSLEPSILSVVSITKVPVVSAVTSSAAASLIPLPVSVADGALNGSGVFVELAATVLI